MSGRGTPGGPGAILALLLCAALLPCSASAYLDPGSGSYFLQIVVAALLTAGVAIKAFAGRIAGALRRLVGGGEPKPPTEEKGED